MNETASRELRFNCSAKPRDLRGVPTASRYEVQTASEATRLVLCATIRSIGLGRQRVWCYVVYRGSMQSQRFKQTTRNGRTLGITPRVLLLLTMAAATSTTAIAAMAAGPPQNEAATVLAAGDPPLTQAMVDRRIAVFEVFFEIKINREQHDLLQRLLVEAWKQGDQEDIHGTVEDVKMYGKESDIVALRATNRSAYVDSLRKQPNDALARLILEIYDAAHPERKDSMSAHGGESHFYAATHGLRGSFYLIGGQYSLYVYAKRPILAYDAPETRECLFGGNLQRVWPTHDAWSLGAGILVSTIVPHKIDKPLTLPAGLYALYVTTLTDCNWQFSLISTSEDPAGITPVTMLKRAQVSKEIERIGILGDPVRYNPMDPAVSASVREPVRFYAQFRTDHNEAETVSGTMQLIHDGKVIFTMPLKPGIDAQSACVFLADVMWKPEASQYLGTNTVKFIVKIGSAEFTSTGEFTLTQ